MQRSIATLCLSCLLGILTVAASAQPFEDFKDGSIRDTDSGLLWQKCSMGQAKGGKCSGSGTLASWSEADEYCRKLDLASRTDWRLPTLEELNKLVDVKPPEMAQRSPVAGAGKSLLHGDAAGSAAWLYTMKHPELNSPVEKNPHDVIIDKELFPGTGRGALAGTDEYYYWTSTADPRSAQSMRLVSFTRDVGPASFPVKWQRGFVRCVAGKTASRKDKPK